MNEMQSLATAPPNWVELLRALWPVFVVLAGLGIGGIVLALKSMFVGTASHKAHHDRILVVETFVTEQKTALGILPTRQELATQINRQGERIAQTREDITEQIADLGERVAGIESAVRSLGDQGKTTNTYLHTLIERGLK